MKNVFRVTNFPGKFRELQCSFLFRDGDDDVDIAAEGAAGRPSADGRRVSGQVDDGDHRRRDEGGLLISLGRSRSKEYRVK